MNMASDFTESFKKAIDIEQKADSELTDELLKQYEPKKLAQLGLALTNLVVSGIRTGLGGKTLIELSNDPAITVDPINPGSIRVGDVVKLSRSGPLKDDKSNDSKNKDLDSVDGVVTKISTTLITIATEEDSSDDRVVTLLNDSVRFWLVKLTNSITYKRMVSTMNKLQEMIDGKNGGLSNPIIQLLLGQTKYIGPSKTTKINSFFDPALNQSQKNAINFAIDSPISIIHGPPGTGKTYTLIELIKQLSFNFNEKVLVCGPSNISVDTILERLSKVFTNEFREQNEEEPKKKSTRRMKKKSSTTLSADKLIRIGHPSRLLSSNLNHSLDVLSKDTEILKDFYRDISDTLHKAKKAKRYSERRALWTELKTLRKELREKEYKFTSQLLRNANVVLSTLHGSGSYELTSLYKDINNSESKGALFDTIIIDEVSQSLEPQCWIPLINHFGFKRLVIAGDNMQLPPTVKSKNNSDISGTLKHISLENVADLEQTLFDRLVKDLDGNKFKTLLDTQYRMNSTIMEFPSKELYENKLQAHSSIANISLKDLGPDLQLSEIPCTIWLDTQGGDFPERSAENGIAADFSGSKYNEHEIALCVEYVSKLIKLGIREQDIGIISPYSAQVSYLKKAFDLNDIEISSIDGFQGREKEIIIISLVRSNDDREVGFLKDKRRLNVAMTRPKRHLCVIGDLSLMQNSGVKFLKNWADYAEEHYEIEYPQVDIS